MGETRAEKARIAKKRIIEAANELFAKRDFDDVSMQDIAKAAGCTAGNIYHYFNGKEELILHTMDSLDEKYQIFYDKLQTSPEYEELPASKKLQLFLEEVMQIMSEGKHQTTVYIYIMKCPESGVKLLNHERFVYRAYQEMIGKMMETGEISPARDQQEILEQIITLTRGIMLEWLAHGKEEDIRNTSRNLFDIYFKGLIADAKNA